MFGAISEKFSTFDKQIYYCVTPQFLTFDDGWGEILVLLTNDTKFPSHYQSIY